ncbi:cytochrome P450 [Luteolibacter flavescens]|uniref:Cytochrome P450 n=1 Tax=Luteolibacter flavescens TaxID=1859460 RepID=A0ABT3FL50_9BACT|nr:cytochrome P450 [Luteolibacter flavescens]MCW1884285.1 cytochrome P450 [Luteolibacter flavescens]
MTHQSTTPRSAIAPERPFTGRLAVTPPFHRQWMLAGNPARFFERLIRDHGDFVRYRGIISFHLINHPELVHQVLKATHRQFDKNSRVYNRFRNAFGDGLVTAEGERWKRQRKMLHPIFSSASIRRFFDLMLESANATAERWSVRARSGEVFNMAAEMDHLMLEIAGRAFFSQAFDRTADRISGWTHAINRYCAIPPLPVISDLRFPTPLNLKLRRVLSEYRDFVRDVIRDRMAGGMKDDLLGVLLTSKDEDTGEPMGEEDIAEEVLGMIIGGHETSSTAMTWIWHELHHHPRIEQRLVEEIEAVCGNAPVTLDQLPHLRLTTMVIQETLRLHPPFWFENRNTISDVELGGVIIPRGSMIVFSRYSVQRHPDFWECPDEFRPERFDPESPENGEGSRAFIPFGSGPRVCIGRHFAMMELVVILVTILQRYRVIVDASDRHEMAARMTMVPKHGLKVRLETRTDFLPA